MLNVVSFFQTMMSGGAPNVHPHFLQWMILQQHLMASSAAMAANINRFRSQHNQDVETTQHSPEVENNSNDDGDSSEEIECDDDFEDSSEMLNNNFKRRSSQISTKFPESSISLENKDNDEC